MRIKSVVNSDRAGETAARILLQSSDVRAEGSARLQDRSTKMPIDVNAMRLSAIWLTLSAMLLSAVCFSVRA